MVSPFITTCGMWTYIHIHTNMSIPDYNLISLYNVNFMYVFRAYHLAQDKEIVCSSLGKTTSLISGFPWVLIVCYVGLSPHISFLSALSCQKIPVFGQLSFGQ